MSESHPIALMRVSEKDLLEVSDGNPLGRRTPTHRLVVVAVESREELVKWAADAGLRDYEIWD